MLNLEIEGRHGYLRLANDAIVLGRDAVLAKRYADQGWWRIERLEERTLAELLAFACDLGGESGARSAKAILDAAALIGGNDNEVRARLNALPLRLRIDDDELHTALKLVRRGATAAKLPTEMRKEKLGLPLAADYCPDLRLTERGVVLGLGTVIAALAELPGDRIGLKIEGNEERILALLSVAAGAIIEANVIEKLSAVSRSLQRGDIALASIGLALLGQPPLHDRGAAVVLSESASALRSGAEPEAVLKALGLLADWDEVECLRKASPDDPVRPGWPAKTPGGKGGQFRPKNGSTAPGIGHNGGPPSEDIWVRPPKTGVIAIKSAIRFFATRAIAATVIEAPAIALAIGVSAALAELAAPYVVAYFDSPKSLEDLQAAANFPETGYDIHHVVEQATAAADGSEARLIDAPDNLVKIPTVKHWELNGWYERTSEDYGGMTPRQYVKGRSWTERREVGLKGLRYIGVLK